MTEEESEVLNGGLIMPNIAPPLFPIIVAGKIIGWLLGK